MIASGCGDDATSGASGPDAVAVVDTRVQPNQITAGDTVTVECLAANAAGDLIDGVAFELVLTPSEGIDAAALDVTATASGAYEVACREADSGVVDASPSALTVNAGPMVGTVLSLDPSTVDAGVAARATCHGVDAYGNATQDGAFVAATPPDAALTIDGRDVSAEVTGEWDLICDANGVDAEDKGTATLTVVPGSAAALALRYLPPRGSYPIDEPITVEGDVVDAYGNHVGGEPVMVTNLAASPGGHHEVVGTNLNRLEFDTIGHYTVTADAADGSGLSGEAPIVIDGIGPDLQLTSPERGLVEGVHDTVTVAGTVTDNLGEIASLSVAGEPIDVAGDGSFAVEIDLAYATNILLVEARDPWGNATWTTRSIERSHRFIAMDDRDIDGDAVNNALVVIMTQDAIDDGDHDEMVTNDIATLFLRIIEGVDLAAFLPDPLTSFSCFGGDCTINVTDFSLGDASVSLDLMAGRIHFELDLLDPFIEISLFFPCDSSACPQDPMQLPGVISMDRVDVSTDIFLSIVDGETRAHTENTMVTLEGLDVDLNDPTGLAQGLVGTIIAFIEDPLVDGLELLFVGLIEEQLADALAGVFDPLSLNETLEVPSLVDGEAPNAIVLETKAKGVDIAPQRLQVRLDAIAYAETPARPYPHLGSLDHRGCRAASPVTFPPPTRMVVAIHDNFINQILFALWEGGTLSMDIPAGGMDDLVGDFGITDMSLYTEARLPPIFDSCGDPIDDAAPRPAADKVQLGDLYLEADLIFGGAPMNISAWLSLESLLEVVIAENDAGVLEATLEIGEFDPFHIELVRNEGFFEGDDETVVGLIKDALIPQVLGSLDDSLSFELPQIDLGEISDAFPPGTTIGLDVDGVVRDNAYLELQGSMK